MRLSRLTQDVDVLGHGGHDLRDFSTAGLRRGRTHLWTLHRLRPAAIPGTGAAGTLLRHVPADTAGESVGEVTAVASR
ncbi:hypothetical protein Asera_55150 [Actinocatenispora sera]|uniref:Uncharacterized protein n=1 Tax=Actinocatenispora sera TaxID=390989 RepID=A0A810L842_9ACTN|nr:hypothetical protein Asera_55150 [Actinocatenispora sera]